MRQKNIHTCYKKIEKIPNFRSEFRMQTNKWQANQATYTRNPMQLDAIAICSLAEIDAAVRAR